MEPLTTLPATKRTKEERERDQWEERALVIMRRVYSQQQGRLMPILLQADRADMARLVAGLFEGEPAQVAADVRRFMDELANDVAAASLSGVGVTADPDTVLLAINSLVDQTAAIFGRTMSENSRRLTYSLIQGWLETPGSTVGELRQRVGRIWKGPRPAAAATTETTRLVSESRRTAWEASGVIWGYNVRTKNDDRVRPTHDAVAAAGPYPMSDRQHQPPINGDINCRCVISPVVENPNG